MISFVLALSLAGSTSLGTQSSGESLPASADNELDSSEYVHDFEHVGEGEFDPASVPVINGIVWYGAWEDAMAEVERSGRPVMLHMGSPRCPDTCVPGTW
ncbi:MAG: hypothetical protein ACI8X5_001943 [Planctomycetota bacterium]|jgi:hypothetical protein